jgi:hypothetical protein
LFDAGGDLAHQKRLGFNRPNLIGGVATMSNAEMRAIMAKEKARLLLTEFGSLDDGIELGTFEVELVLGVCFSTLKEWGRTQPDHPLKWFRREQKNFYHGQTRARGHGHQATAPEAA